MAKETTDIESLLEKAQAGGSANSNGSTESFTSTRDHMVPDGSEPVEKNNKAESERSKDVDLDDSVDSIEKSPLAKALEQIKAAYMKAYKAKPKTTIISSIFAGLFLLASLSGDETNKTNIQNSKPEHVSNVEKEVNVATFEGFVEPEVSFESAFNQNPDGSMAADTEKTNNDTKLDEFVSDELQALADLASEKESAEKIKEEEFKAETEFKIKDIQSISEQTSSELEQHIQFSMSEIEALRSTIKQMTNTISNLQDDVNAKKYDLGYEKDRPLLTLKATVPAPDNCNNCVSHASFIYDGITYQKADDSSWNGFSIEILGNRMSLLKDDYVYDYWVGQ